MRRWPQAPLPQQVAPTTAPALAALATSPVSCAQHGCSSGHVLGTTAPDFSIFKHCDPTSSLLFKQSSLGFHPMQKPGFGPAWSDLSWRAGPSIKEGQRSSQVPLHSQTGVAHLGWGNTRAKYPHPIEAEAGSRGLRSREKDKVLTSGRWLSIQHMTSFSQQLWWPQTDILLGSLPPAGTAPGWGDPSSKIHRLRQGGGVDSGNPSSLQEWIAQGEARPCFIPLHPQGLPLLLLPHRDFAQTCQQSSISTALIKVHPGTTTPSTWER